MHSLSVWPSAAPLVQPIASASARCWQRAGSQRETATPGSAAASGDTAVNRGRWCRRCQDDAARGGKRLLRHATDRLHVVHTLRKRLMQLQCYWRWWQPRGSSSLIYCCSCAWSVQQLQGPCLVRGMCQRALHHAAGKKRAAQRGTGLERQSNAGRVSKFVLGSGGLQEEGASDPTRGCEATGQAKRK